MLSRSLAPLLTKSSGRVGAWTARRSVFSLTSDRSVVDVERFPPSMANTVINTCPQGSVAIIERFGKLERVQNPGIFVCIPFVHQIAHLVDMRELTLVIRPQLAITRDNVSVVVGGSLYVQVIDPIKACYNVRRVLVAIQTHAISALRTTIGSVELDELLHNRTILNKRLLETVESAAEPWGLEVKRLELTEIQPDPEVSRAMDAQATAERRKRETILNAEAVRAQAITESEGQRQESINRAEGRKRQVVLEAEARQEQQVLEAQGQAEALERVSKVLETEHGRRAMEFYLCAEYFRTLGAGLTKSSTVFMSDDLGDAKSIFSKGMGIMQAMSGTAGGTSGGQQQQQQGPPQGQHQQRGGAEQ